MDDENRNAESNEILPKTDTLENGVSLNKEQEEEGVSLHKEEAGEPAMVASEEMPVTEASYDFDDTSAPVATAKKSNRNLIVGVAVLVIIAVVGVIAGPKLMANPLTKVLAAFTKTAAEVGTTPSLMEQVSGMGAALKTMNKGKTTLKGELSLVETPDSLDSEDTLSGLGLSYELNTDMPGKLFFLDLGMMMDASKIVNAEFYGSADNFDFAIPALINGHFRVPLTNIGKAYKDSILYQYQPMDVADDYSLSFFDATETEGVSKTYAAVALKHAEWGKRLKKELTAEKTDQADMQVGEKMLPCQGYAIAMTDEKANAFFQDYITYWQTDADAQVFLDDIAQASAASNSYSGYMTPAEAKEEMRSAIDELLVMVRKMELSNMTFNSYIDKNDIIRKFILAGDITSEGEALHMELDSQLAGVGRAVDDLNLTLSMDVEDVAVSIKLQNRQYQDGDNVITEGTFLGGNQYEDAIKSHWNLTYNTQDSLYSLDTDMQFGENAIGISSQGELEVTEKGKAFHLNMDTIDIAVSEYGGTENLSLKGLFSLDQLTEAVKQPSGTEYKLLELDESGFQAVIFEAYGNVMRLGNELSGIFN